MIDPAAQLHAVGNSEAVDQLFQLFHLRAIPDQIQGDAPGLDQRCRRLDQHVCTLIGHQSAKENNLERPSISWLPWRSRGTPGKPRRIDRVLGDVKTTVVKFARHLPQRVAGSHDHRRGIRPHRSIARQKFVRIPHVAQPLAFLAAGPVKALRPGQAAIQWPDDERHTDLAAFGGQKARRGRGQGDHPMDNIKFPRRQSRAILLPDIVLEQVIQRDGQRRERGPTGPGAAAQKGGDFPDGARGPFGVDDGEVLALDPSGILQSRPITPVRQHQGIGHLANGFAVRVTHQRHADHVRIAPLGNQQNPWPLAIEPNRRFIPRQSQGSGRSLKQRIQHENVSGGMGVSPVLFLRVLNLL